MAKSEVVERASAVSLTSESGRTSVTVSLDDEGKGTVVVTQDGHVWSSFDIPRELRGPNGEPRNTN